MSEKTEKQPIDLGPMVERAKAAGARAEATPKAPWIALDAPRVVYGDCDHGIDRVIVVYGLTAEARTITSFLGDVREDVPALAEGVLAMADEITRLRAALVEAAGRLDTAADIIEDFDGEVDGDNEEARDTAARFRKLAGAPEHVDSLKLYRVDSGDLYAARSATQAAKRWSKDAGLGPINDDEAVLVIEDPLTLAMSGFDRFGPPQATAAIDPVPQEVTLPLSAWLEGEEAGLFWEKDH